MTDNKLPVGIYLLFLPVAYISYLFHEFGHWTAGELLGNRMVYSLNYVWPVSGQYHLASHGLYVSMGGPAFTLILSFLCLMIIEHYGTLYLYPFVFFQAFMRTFALLFGGFSTQDEARIASILRIGPYTVAILVFLLLFAMTARASHRLNISPRINSYLLVVSTLCQLMVIGTYTMLP